MPVYTSYWCNTLVSGEKKRKENRIEREGGSNTQGVALATKENQMCVIPQLMFYISLMSRDGGGGLIGA